MESITLYRVFLMISIFISSRSCDDNGSENAVSQKTHNGCLHLFVDAGLKEGSQGSVHQNSIVKLSRSARKCGMYRFSSIILLKKNLRSLKKLLPVLNRGNQPGNMNGLHLFEAAQRMALANLSKVFRYSEAVN